MKITQTIAGEYTLASHETDHLQKRVYIRFRDAGGDVQHAKLEDMPVPLDPGDEPTPPTASAPLTGSPTMAEVEAFQERRATFERDEHAYPEAHASWAAQRDARKLALSEQRWSAWLADPRPDHLKAEEHFRRARGMGPA